MEGTHYNLVIYGGNPAGLACAVRAAREGLTVLLVNHTPHIGIHDPGSTRIGRF